MKKCNGKHSHPMTKCVKAAENIPLTKFYKKLYSENYCLILLYKKYFAAIEAFFKHSESCRSFFSFIDNRFVIVDGIKKIEHKISDI